MFPLLGIVTFIAPGGAPRGPLPAMLLEGNSMPFAGMRVPLIPFAGNSMPFAGMRVLFNADFVYVPFAGRIGTAFADDCVPFVDGCTNEVFAGCTAVEEFDCMPYFWFRYVNTNAAAIASSATHTNITVSRSFFSLFLTCPVRPISFSVLSSLNYLFQRIR
jgi:hypothetical protein